MDDFIKAISDSEQLLSELETKRASAQAAIASIGERRRGLALGAELGDTASKKTLAKLTDEQHAAEERLLDLGYASEAAGRALDETREQARRADLAKRRAAYGHHAEAALSAAREIDVAARALVAARGRLLAAHGAMAATGVANSALNRLVFRSSGSHALVAHGFANFTDLPRAGGPLNEHAFFDLVSGVVGAARSTREAA